MLKEEIEHGQLGNVTRLTGAPIILVSYKLLPKHSVSFVYNWLHTFYKIALHSDLFIYIGRVDKNLSGEQNHLTQGKRTSIHRMAFLNRVISSLSTYFESKSANFKQISEY